MTSSASNLDELGRIVQEARERFTQLVAKHTAGGLTVQTYQRYLSMQYHLTKGVQRYFLAAAAHPDMARLRPLRKFLVDFANEEELHYLVAALDLQHLQLEICAPPLDVELWHAYFTDVVQRQPFIRLGAAAVLENLSGPENRGMFKRILGAPFLDRNNTKFLVLHMHEALPHGEQILSALASVSLTRGQVRDLEVGARKGAVMYLRMAEWALDSHSLGAWPDAGRPGAALSAQDDQLLDQARALTAANSQPERAAA